VRNQHKIAGVICLALAALVCFFSIAVYTPLHVHKNGDPKQCSLNNIEHQVADSVTPVLELPAPVDDPVLIAIEIAAVEHQSSPREPLSRGPPTSSRFAA
jgi:hypothetical protein